MKKEKVFTIGHSKHSKEQFLEMLVTHRISVLVDIRSVPRSRFNPQYNREALAGWLAAAGVEYVYLGKELGARRSDPLTLDEDGKVDFFKVWESPEFETGVEQIVHLLRQDKGVVLMCSEADPFDCHRFCMMAYPLQLQGIEVLHILRDNSVIPNEKLEDELVRRFGSRAPAFGSPFEAAFPAERGLRYYYRQLNRVIAWSHIEEIQMVTDSPTTIFLVWIAGNCISATQPRIHRIRRSDFPRSMIHPIYKCKTMNIQFVCLANSLQEGGRRLAGLLLRNNKLVFQNGKPQWIRPVMRGFQHGFLTGLVVDLLPLDVLEIEVLETHDDESCEGRVFCDPYSIRVRGKYERASLLSELEASNAAAIPNMPQLPDRSKADLVGDEMWMVNAIECKVVETFGNAKAKSPKLTMSFKCTAGNFELPIKDPWFIAAFAVEPELLSKASPNLVLAMKGKPGKRKTQNIAAVLI
jgi:hypothetical protein